MVWRKRRLAYADKARLDAVDGPCNVFTCMGKRVVKPTLEMSIYTYLNR